MIYLANANNEVDGSMHNMLLNLKSKYPIVLVSRTDNFKFNEELKTLTDYILVDVCEYGHNREFERTHLFGLNTSDFGDCFDANKWSAFHSWVADNPPLIYFKRELLQDDANLKVRPIEYAAWFEPPPIVSKEEFDARPLEVFFNWGYSSEYRRQLHGKIWTDAYKYGYMVCDNLYYLNGFMERESNPKKWVSAHIPWFARHPMPDILQVQGLAKISISHWGAGKKCFRSAEAPLNSVMAMPFDDYAWTFDWVHGENCIRFELENSIEKIVHSISRDDLYFIYTNGVATANKYYLPNYLKHLETLINGL